MKLSKDAQTIFFFLFALSGFSGLIYESIWTHYLKLFLGHAAYAQSLVLAIFMGGLALGSYISSRYSPHWKNLLRAYALAEGAIGILALIFHEIFSGMLSISYSAVIPAIGSASAIEIYKWTVSSLIIFPQTVLLGMTFPLMSAGLLRTFPESPGRSISLLYFTNSIGAVLGVLVSGFVLIRLVGLPWTIRIAGVINILVAALVLMIIKDVPASFAAAAKTAAKSALLDKRRLVSLLAVALGTGMASFIYEMGWLRMLSLVLGSSTHSFELMLSSFILGLALGGLWIQRRIDGLENPLRYLALVQVVMGIFAISTLAVYGNLFEVMQWLVGRLPKTGTGYLMFNLSSHAISLVIMLPATVCAGMTLPLITYILMQRGHGEKSIGAVYASNTVGAILGVFFAVHIGMPFLGLKGLLISGAALDIALGLALVWAGSSAFPNIAAICITAAGIAAVVLAGFFFELDAHKMASGVYRQGEILSPATKVLYHQDGKTASVSVTLGGSSLAIRTNGKPDAAIMVDATGLPTEDESTMVLLGALPLSIYPGARTVANIGFGSGLTTHSLLGSQLIERVDTVEIEPFIVDAAKWFRPMVESAFTDSRSRIYIEDAKTFFSTHKSRYDIIVSEPSNPWVSGVSGLFSEEFYEYICQYLNEKGLFVQWVQLYEIDPDLVASIFKALSGRFEDYVVYAPNNHDLIIIASKDGPVGRPGESIFRFAGLSSLLGRIGIGSLQDIELSRVGGKKALGPFFGSFHISANSDYYPVLDQNAARARFLKSDAMGFMKYSHEPLPAMEMLDGWLPSHSSTKISGRPFFAKSQWSNTAVSFRDYFLGGPGDESRLGAAFMHNAAMMKNLFSGCRSSESSEMRINGAFNVAVQMIPYLTPAELEEVWQALESGSCAERRSPQESEWVSLFRAVGKRDAAAMERHSLTLLRASSSLTDVETKYLVAAGMLGSIVNGNREGCNALWNEYSSYFSKQVDLPAIFPVLAAKCSNVR
ncbi:MAG: hypothetical protein WAV13_11850 [Thermodesulfovibrionales bacterium]